MSSEHLIPPGVDEQDAALLRRAYALNDQTEGAQLYREWASTYDRTMIDGLGYVSPQRLVEVFARNTTRRNGDVLDLGCGTGLIGVELASHGFTTFDGLDLSVEMMAEAERRSLYRRCLTADLTTPLALPDASYFAAICNGTFTSGHVDAACLDELVRIIEPGGYLVCAVHHVVWDASGFAVGFARLEGAGLLVPVEVVESAYYLSSSGTDGRLCVFRRK
jgi:predicted TPR repeat methyltransferase